MEDTLKNMMNDLDLDNELEIMVKDQDDDSDRQCNDKGPGCTDHSIG